MRWCCKYLDPICKNYNHRYLFQSGIQLFYKKNCSITYFCESYFFTKGLHSDKKPVPYRIASLYSLSFAKLGSGPCVELARIRTGQAKGKSWSALLKVDPAEKLQNCNSADSSGDVAKLRVPTLQFCKTRRRKIAFLLNKLGISLNKKDFFMNGQLNHA